MADALSPRTIETDHVRLVVAPERGARIASLIDRRTGRDWLAQGEAPLLEDRHAHYGLAEAAGWDECFPTISPCVIAGPPWAGPLRDHGELWGRRWSVDEAGERRLVTTCSSAAFRFTRALVLEGASLEVDYRVENLTAGPMPILWAMHPLFALRPGESIELPGAAALVPTYLSTAKGADALALVPWPEGDERIHFPIDRVQSAAARFAGKFFTACDVRGARLGGPTEWLDMSWRGITSAGIWITYGAWPSPNDVVHVAVEPTTSPDDRLSDAIERGQALTLSPQDSAAWSVSLSLRTRLNE
jgi:galactose mutarotase-like enzyme